MTTLKLPSQAFYTMALSDSSVLPVPHLPRNAVIAIAVVVFHIGMLWALQTGLLRRAIEIIVPVQVLTELITPPMPKTVPSEPKPRPPEPQAVPKKALPQLPAAPVPVALPDAPTTPNAPIGVVAAQPPAPPIAAPVAAAPTPAPPPAPMAPPKVELPSSDASYLQNPTAAYPPMSKRLGEQGKVLVRVLIGVDGLPQRAELKRSSGFDRLDRAALDYVMKCRYVPGKVGGTPQPMWYEAPVNFVLE